MNIMHFKQLKNAPEVTSIATFSTSFSEKNELILHTTKQISQEKKSYYFYFYLEPSTFPCTLMPCSDCSALHVVNLN